MVIMLNTKNPRGIPNIFKKFLNGILAKNIMIITFNKNIAACTRELSDHVAIIRKPKAKINLALGLTFLKLLLYEYLSIRSNFFLTLRIS